MYGIGRTWQNHNMQYDSNTRYDKEWESPNTQYNSNTRYDKEWQNPNPKYNIERSTWQNYTDDAILSNDRTLDEIEEAKDARSKLTQYITNHETYYSDDTLNELTDILRKVNPTESEYFKRKIQNY